MELAQEERDEMQRANVIALAGNGGFKFSKPGEFFLYTSGQIGPYFVQSIDITKDGHDYSRAVSDLAELVERTLGATFRVISGGESRDWDFSCPVAYDLAVPHAKLYKDPAKNKPLGADMQDANVVHVADLQNEGSSIRDAWKPQIENAGGRLVHAFFYVDRLEDGVDVMKALGVPSDAVVPLNGLAWQALMDEGIVSSEQYDMLCARSEDKTAWAHYALRNNIGLLVDYLKNPANAAKAEKVLLKGYPDLRAELEERMAEKGYKHEFTR